jgi:hypothetical protein
MPMRDQRVNRQGAICGAASRHRDAALAWRRSDLVKDFGADER